MNGFLLGGYPRVTGRKFLPHYGPESVICGLAGIFRAQGAQNGDMAVVEAMVDRLFKRGPDGSGFAAEDAITLGHRRLKIIDCSENGKQPMVSHDGRFVLVFNGECYNFRDLQKELGLEPSALKSTSDTEILLEAWSRLGPACLPKIVGQFAIAVYDRETRKLFLARDRFGEKPLFYHRSSDGSVYFASSLGSLLAAPAVPKTLSRAAVEELLTLRYVLAPRTVVSNVFKVEPGSLVEIEGQKLTTTRWYELEFASENTAPLRMNEAETLEEFDRLFRQAAQRCLVSDVPTGLLLSDGIDSQAIYAVFKDAQVNIPTFTYGYYSADHALGGLGNVKTNARSNAHYFNFTVDERVDSMGKAFASLTEPVGDGASLATWLLLKQASKHATVFLCGHGSDEVLGGYRLSQDLLRLRVLRHLSGIPAALTGKLFDRYMYGPESPGEKVQALRRSSLNAIPNAARYLIHRPLPVDDLGILFGQNQRASEHPYLHEVESLYAECAPGAMDLDRIQRVMVRTFLSENILSYADSVSMDQSTELRLPFLDRDLVHFVMRVPARQRVRFIPTRRSTKALLRSWGDRYMPPEIVHAKKKSFNFGSLRPLMQSHGNQLKSYVLDSSAVRAVIPGAEAWLAKPPEYFRGCWQGTLWALLALGVWSEANGVRAE